MYNEYSYIKMGVKLLNTLLQRLNTKGIVRTDLKRLKGKKIVVDANIYMYRYAAFGNIIEHFYLMCSIMRYYDIHPIFIFDGNKKIRDKAEILKNRKDTKKKHTNTLDEYVLDRAQYGYLGSPGQNAVAMVKVQVGQPLGEIFGPGSSLGDIAKWLELALDSSTN